MKRFLSLALLVLVCACCLTSCASVEQEIGKKISVAAVEAVAAELAQNGVEYELVTDEEPLDQAALVVEEALGTALLGDLTAYLEGAYVDSESGVLVKYYTYGFSAAADADAVEQMLLKKYDEQIKENKVIVVNGGYIVSLTLSSVAIEQGE